MLDKKNPRHPAGIFSCWSRGFYWALGVSIVLHSAILFYPGRYTLAKIVKDDVNHFSQNDRFLSVTLPPVEKAAELNQGTSHSPEIEERSFLPPVFLSDVLQSDGEEYHKSSEVDIKPQVDGPVVVPFPHHVLGKERGRVRLVLYVANDGLVSKVEVDEIDVPEEFVLAAQNTFLGLQMSPGIKNGKPVPVRMKIEVDFVESRGVHKKLN